MKNIKKHITKKNLTLAVVIALSIFLIFKFIKFYKLEVREENLDKNFSYAKEAFIKDRLENKFAKLPIKDSYNMLMVIEGEGDWMVSNEILKGCDNLEWKCKRYYKKFPAEQEDILLFNPDIIFIMTHSFYPIDILRQLNPQVWHSTTSFYYLSYSLREAFNEKIYKPKKTVPYIFDFLDGLLVVDENYNVIKKYKNNFFTNKNASKEIEYMLFYPSRSKTKFKPLNYKSIFYASVNVDPVRGGEKYLKLYSMLDKTSYFGAYGPAESWLNIEHSYKGYVKNIDEEIENNGIYLLLHGARHLNEKELGIPTGRIFEAVANSAVVISDKNKFVIENFGDNVLYIDQNSTADEMFSQINKHYEWIILHPEEARKKAMNCHEIFIKKFTIEKQLQNLAHMTEFIKQKKLKEKNK